MGQDMAVVVMHPISTLARRPSASSLAICPPPFGTCQPPLGLPMLDQLSNLRDIDRLPTWEPQSNAGIATTPIKAVDRMATADHQPRGIDRPRRPERYPTVTPRRTRPTTTAMVTAIALDIFPASEPSDPGTRLLGGTMKSWRGLSRQLRQCPNTEKGIDAAIAACRDRIGTTSTGPPAWAATY